MDLTINYSYVAQIIPPRCRNPRPQRFDDGSVTLTVREVTAEQAPIAIQAAQMDFESGVYKEPISYRWFEGRLWTDVPVCGCSRSRHSTQYPALPAALSLITDSATLSNSEFGIYVGVHGGKDGIAAHLQTCSGDWLIIDGQLHRTAGEPMYVVMTFGMSHNHGGTSLMTDDHLNPNLKREAYFSLLEQEQAVAYTLAVADNRGDTVKVSTDSGFRFEVLIPEAIQWKNSNSDAKDTAMTTQQICARIDHLEMSLNGDETDDDTRADILDEIAELEGRRD